MAAPGLILAAAASGSGKTALTLGILRHLKQRGVAPCPFKVGPDYIDPAFHTAATGTPCVNLDSWAMRPEGLAGLAAGIAAEADLVIGEGVMGLFDGAPDGTGSTADLAAMTGWPVVLIVDVSGMGASAGALVRGFAGHRADVPVAGVIFNRLGGPRHGEIVAGSMAGLGIPVLGRVPRLGRLSLPSRHLGLVQAGERDDLRQFLDGAAQAVAEHVDIESLTAIARPGRFTVPGAGPGIPPLGQRIAVASDPAFAFAYPHVLRLWREGGVEILPFSPLNDQAPDASADAVYLPGGYPELHGGRLSGNRNFLVGLRAAAARGAVVYGECGGYMVLGEALIDGDGVRHPMAGLLGHVTSFAAPKRHLGYRRVQTVSDSKLGGAGAALKGHEFHYATLESGDRESPVLFRAEDALGHDLGTAGAQRGAVMGSFVHLIDRA